MTEPLVRMPFNGIRGIESERGKQKGSGGAGFSGAVNLNRAYFFLHTSASP